MTRFQEVAKRLFAVRSFKGQDPAVIRERFRLVQGLVCHLGSKQGTSGYSGYRGTEAFRDVLAGRLSETTARRLAVEVSDRLLAGGPLGPGIRVSPQRISKALLALFGRDHSMFRAELGLRQFGRMRRF